MLADVVLKTITILKEMRIAQLSAENDRTLVGEIKNRADFWGYQNIMPPVKIALVLQSSSLFKSTNMSNLNGEILRRTKALWLFF